MKRVLVTGISGVGKSALLEELASRGYATVDTDYGDFHEVVDGERLWRRERIEAVLRDAAADKATMLFVQGTVRNQGLFYPLFDHIVLLSAPVEVLVERLSTRTTNSYGKDPAELAETLGYVETVEPLLRASATLELVTTVPVASVADAIWNTCASGAGGRSAAEDEDAPEAVEDAGGQAAAQRLDQFRPRS